MRDKRVNVVNKKFKVNDTNKSIMFKKKKFFFLFRKIFRGYLKRPLFFIKKRPLLATNLKNISIFFFTKKGSSLRRRFKFYKSYTGANNWYGWKKRKTVRMSALQYGRFWRFHRNRYRRFYKNFISLFITAPYKLRFETLPPLLSKIDCRFIKTIVFFFCLFFMVYIYIKTSNLKKPLRGNKGKFQPKNFLHLTRHSTLQFYRKPLIFFLRVNKAKKLIKMLSDAKEYNDKSAKRQAVDLIYKKKVFRFFRKASKRLSRIHSVKGAVSDKKFFSNVFYYNQLKLNIFRGATPVYKQNMWRYEKVFKFITFSKPHTVYAYQHFLLFEMSARILLLRTSFIPYTALVPFLFRYGFILRNQNPIINGYDVIGVFETLELPTFLLIKLWRINYSNFFGGDYKLEYLQNFNNVFSIKNWTFINIHKSKVLGQILVILPLQVHNFISVFKHFTRGQIPHSYTPIDSINSNRINLYLLYNLRFFSYLSVYANSFNK
jgi:hypothetical protein